MPWLSESETSMIVLAGFNSLVSEDGIVTCFSGNAEIGNGCKGRYVDRVVDFCEVKSDPPCVCFDAFIPLLRGSHDESGWLYSWYLGFRRMVLVMTDQDTHIFKYKSRASLFGPLYCVFRIQRHVKFPSCRN